MVSTHPAKLHVSGRHMHVQGVYVQVLGGSDKIFMLCQQMRAENINVCICGKQKKNLSFCGFFFSCFPVNVTSTIHETSDGTVNFQCTEVSALSGKCSSKLFSKGNCLSLAC